jgi:hypothetical protein
MAWSQVWENIVSVTNYIYFPFKICYFIEAKTNKQTMRERKTKQNEQTNKKTPGFYSIVLCSAKCSI